MAPLTLLLGFGSWKRSLGPLGHLISHTLSLCFWDWDEVTLILQRKLASCYPLQQTFLTGDSFHVPHGLWLTGRNQKSKQKLSILLIAALKEELHPMYDCLDDWGKPRADTKLNPKHP